MGRFLIILMLVSTVFASCSAHGPNPRDVEKRKVYYKMVTRQHPPEEVYSRVTWSHLPQPIAAKAQNNAPLLEPTISFELPNSSLKESVEALAQAIGFRWDYPPSLSNVPVSINKVGTVSEILTDIEKQAEVKTELNFTDRVIRVIDPSTLPSLRTNSN